MEKKFLQSQNNVNPLDRSSSTLSSQKAIAKPRPEQIAKVVKKFDEEANTEADLLVDENTEHINSNKIINLEINDRSSSHNYPEKANRVSAKSDLHEICAANKWKPPLFECYKEEGPCHLRLFTFKVTVEIEGRRCLALECFGCPRPTKKKAAEHAAEGALWYLKHFDYFPTKRCRRKGKKNDN